MTKYKSLSANTLREATKLPTLTNVRTDIEKLKSKILNKELAPKAITSMAAKIGVKHSFEVTSDTSSKADSGKMMMNAFFDPEEDADDEISIEIQLIYNNKDKTLVLSKEGWKWLVDTIISSLTHEMIHQKQYRARGHIIGKQFTKFTSDAENVQGAQKYLGNTDETEAYGYTIASHLINNFSYDEATAFLRNPTKDLLKHSPDLFAYMVAFEMNVNHPVIKRLLKKTVYYLNKLKR